MRYYRNGERHVLPPRLALLLACPPKPDPTYALARPPSRLPLGAAQFHRPLLSPVCAPRTAHRCPASSTLPPAAVPAVRAAAFGGAQTSCAAPSHRHTVRVAGSRGKPHLPAPGSNPLPGMRPDPQPSLCPTRPPHAELTVRARSSKGRNRRCSLLMPVVAGSCSGDPAARATAAGCVTPAVLLAAGTLASLTQRHKPLSAPQPGQAGAASGGLSMNLSP